MACFGRTLPKGPFIVAQLSMDWGASVELLAAGRSIRLVKFAASASHFVCRDPVWREMGVTPLDQTATDKRTMTQGARLCSLVYRQRCVHMLVLGQIEVMDHRLGIHESEE